MPPPEVTVSIGVADLDDITLPTFLSLHAAADAALYAAKAAGRDRVLAAPPRSDTRRTPVARRPKVGYIPAVAALTATPDSSS